MGRTLVFLSLLAAVFYPVAAHAASCDETNCILTISEVGDPANTYTFAVPGYDVTPAATDGSSYFAITGVAVTGPDGYSSSDDTLYFYPTDPAYTDLNGDGSYTGGLWDPSITDDAAQPGSGFYGFMVADATFFTGPVTSPTFQLSAMTTDGPLVSYWGDQTYNYSLTEAPEPSSLMLLGTGVMGLVSAYRRRRAA